jgi:hemerythrin-like domain-containing protein
MGDAPATDSLRADHQVILRVIEVLGNIAESMQRGAEPPLDRIRKIVHFSINFVDRCHHGKEEDCLFPCLEKRGIPREGGPIGVMLAEHEEGRRLVRQISEVTSSYSESDRGLLAQLCAEYVDLLTQHIFKENNILFAMADDVMTGDDQAQVSQGYARLEAERLSAGGADELRRLAEDIAGG